MHENRPQELNLSQNSTIEHIFGRGNSVCFFLLLLPFASFKFVGVLRAICHYALSYGCNGCVWEPIKNNDFQPKTSKRFVLKLLLLFVCTYRYRAVYKYRPQNSDELELQEGDTVYVLEKCDDGWFVGTSQRTGFFGTFPGNYVERIWMQLAA